VTNTTIDYHASDTPLVDNPSPDKEEVNTQNDSSKRSDAPNEENELKRNLMGSF